jgi:hypothetical protein
MDDVLAKPYPRAHPCGFSQKPVKSKKEIKSLSENPTICSLSFQINHSEENVDQYPALSQQWVKKIQ